MKKHSKSYPAVPAGKKLIFRWSFVHPQTGATIYARRRPFPIVVDDVPQNRPVKVVMPKPVQRARPRPVRAFSVPPQHLVQPPRMSPVEVVPPAQPPKPHPGAHGDAHNVVGAVFGGIHAGRQVPAGQSPAAAIAEMVGGGLGGAGATYVSAAVGQHKPKEHDKAVEGLLQMVGQHSPELVQGLRAQAEEFRQKRLAESGPNGSIAAEVIYFILEMAMHVGVGALNGAPAGARAHVALVNPTEQNIQRLVSST